MADMDKILTQVKTGKWNYLYFVGIGLCGFLTASNVLGGAFLTPNVEHICRPSNDLDVIEVNQCNFTHNATTDLLNGFVAKEEKCSSWDFMNNTFSTTITSDFELVCEDNYWRATFQTAYMIGNFFGSPLNGFISDKFGRRLTVTTGSVVFIASSILTSFMPTFLSLLSLRFVLGLMHPAVLQTGYILCMEICEPKHRSTVGIMISLPWALGTIWWGFLGYLIRDWRNLQMAASFPGLIILTFLCFFDESPRWLIVKGQYEKAYKVLEKAARWNNSTIPEKDKLMDIMKGIKEDSTDKGAEVPAKETVGEKVKKVLLQIIVLFRTPEIRKRTLLVYVDFIVASTVYYGLSLNSKNFSADPFIYMMLTGLMEVPAYTLTAPIVARAGRRIPTSFCYSLCGVTILILAFIPAEPAWLVITLAMIGKLCISSAYQILYLISSEIFPTEVRLQGLGTSNLVARIGAASSPFITDLLGASYPWAPSMVFGSAGIIAGIATLLLPETLNQPMPETIYQLENQKIKMEIKLESLQEKVRSADASETKPLQDV